MVLAQARAGGRQSADQAGEVPKWLCVFFRSRSVLAKPDGCGLVKRSSRLGQGRSRAGSVVLRDCAAQALLRTLGPLNLPTQ